jgi:hypothetical protein
MTGLIGPDATNTSQKKHVSPRNVHDPGHPFVGDRKHQVMQYRNNRKKPVPFEEKRILASKDWSDYSQYPSELPNRNRSPRKKESPRINADFGKSRTLFDVDKNYNRFNEKYYGPQKLDRSAVGDDFIRKFSEKQKSYRASMDKWDTTQRVTTTSWLRPKTPEQVEW